MTRTLPRWISVALIALAGALLGALAFGAQPAHAQGPGRADAWERRAPARPGPNTASSLSGPDQWTVAALPALYRDCSILAYQSWDGDDFELYTARGDGSDPVRLTINPGPDETPNLSPDGTMIAYAAEVGGNHDIYTMSTSGGNVQRITTHASEDWFPSFSPDGARVAFQSYREGDQADVYVATLATGAIARVTTHTAYDGQPDWSPDGKRIVFVSDRDEVYRKNLWIMNADGSDAHRITDYSSTGGPRWSPDGQTIVFSADDQDDGFPSLWAVDASGANARLLWRAPGSLSDVWPGAWSFDSRYVIYEEATWYWDTSASEWYVSTAYLDGIAADGSGERHRLTGLGINMAASWRFLDRGSPVSTISPLPKTSMSPAILSWWGSDTCTDDLAFNIQYRQGGTSTWRDWSPTSGETWTAARFGHFAWSREGTVVHFRSRARDASGNAEPWPSGGGDAYTSFPARISGHVRDVRGVPIVEAMMVGPPPTMGSTMSGSSGAYWLDASSEGSGALVASADLYETLRLAQPAMASAQGLEFVLADETNLITNGGFEAGQVGWYARGGARAQSSDCGYDGAVAKIGEGYALEPMTEVRPAVGGDAVKGQELAAVVPALWQAVTVPADMHRPTLSLMFALTDKAPQDGARFYAVVGAGAEETTVIERTNPTPWREVGGISCPVWQHAWADLSAWSGKTITVALRYDPGWTQSTVLVDEVSVGPWLTPRIDDVSPSRGPAGVVGELAISGDNLDGQGGGVTVALGDRPLTIITVEATHLTVTVPPTMPIGLHDVTVQTKAGHRAVLPATYTVGGAALIPLIFK